MALPFSQWAQELGDYAGLTGVSAVGMSTCSHEGSLGLCRESSCWMPAG